jgi:hypothetical protein
MPPKAGTVWFECSALRGSWGVEDRAADSMLWWLMSAVLHADLMKIMEIWEGAATYGPGPASKPGEHWLAFPTEYQATSSYSRSGKY